MSISILNPEGGIGRRVLAITAVAAVLGVSAEPAWAPNCTGSKCANKAAIDQASGKRGYKGKPQQKSIKKPDLTIKQK